MSEQATCKRTLEFTVPVDVVQAETDRVAADISAKARMPGFRPGKIPKSLVLKRFEEDIRQQVLDKLLSRYFQERVQREDLKVVSRPTVTDVHFHPGEPLRFTAEFEVTPEFELGEYTGLNVPYREPKATDEDINRRLEMLRERHATFVNIDPRPAADKDYAVVSLRSTAGLSGDPISQDETTIHLGGEGTLPGFSENILGLAPGEEKEFQVTYPADHANARLAGKTITFLAHLKGLRRKELPDLDDEFAKEAGDYQNLDELRDDLRKQILREREYLAQQEAKQRLVEALVDRHEFPVPEAYVDQQIRSVLERQMQEMALQGIDPSKADVDWAEIRRASHDRAVRDVKASMILERIAGREAIETLVEDMDREIQRISKQLREPAAAVRMRYEKDGTLRRIANSIRTDKVLSFLFEQSRKVVAEDPPEGEKDS